jgi:ElaB/YqjD/DUF883 family membrane-anchored ribosome-binding protein
MDQTAGSNKITLGTSSTPARTTRPNSERIDEIRQNIEQTRNEITDTVDQLGEKLKETVDWKSYVSDHPFVAVGGAALVGFFLTRMLIKPRRSPTEELLENLIRTGRDALVPQRKSLIMTVLTLAGKYAWDQYQKQNEEQAQQQQQDEQMQAFQAAYQQLLMQQQQTEDEIGHNQPPRHRTVGGEY